MLDRLQIVKQRFGDFGFDHPAGCNLWSEALCAIESRV
jgi:hypothetical protein